MRRMYNGISGKNVLFRVTDISTALLVMPVRRPFVTPLPTKAKRQRFIHEAEDLVVFSPSFYKKQTSPGIAGEFEELNTLLVIGSEEEDAYRKWFGISGDVEQETIEYHEYYGNYSHRKK